MPVATLEYQLPEEHEELLAASQSEAILSCVYKYYVHLNSKKKSFDEDIKWDDAYMDLCENLIQPICDLGIEVL